MCFGTANCKKKKGLCNKSHMHLITKEIYSAIQREPARPRIILVCTLHIFWPDNWQSTLAYKSVLPKEKQLMKNLCVPKDGPQLKGITKMMFLLSPGCIKTITYWDLDSITTLLKFIFCGALLNCIFVSISLLIQPSC